MHPVYLSLSSRFIHFSRNERQLEDVQRPVTPSCPDPDTACLHERSMPKSTLFARIHPLSSLQLTRAYEKCGKSSQNQYTYTKLPPTRAELFATFESSKLPFKNYLSPFYSNGEDVPEKPREFAGLVYHLKGGKGISSLEEFVTTSEKLVDQSFVARPQFQAQSGWEYAALPPSRRTVKRWLQRRRPSRGQSVPQKEFRSQVRPSAL